MNNKFGGDTGIDADFSIWSDCPVEKEIMCSKVHPDGIKNCVAYSKEDFEVVKHCPFYEEEDDSFEPEWLGGKDGNTHIACAHCWSQGWKGCCEKDRYDEDGTDRWNR